MWEVSLLEGGSHEVSVLAPPNADSIVNPMAEALWARRSAWSATWIPSAIPKIMSDS